MMYILFAMFFIPLTLILSIYCKQKDVNIELKVKLHFCSLHGPLTGIVASPRKNIKTKV